MCQKRSFTKRVNLKLFLSQNRERITSLKCRLMHRVLSRSIVFGYFSSFYFSDTSDVYDPFHQTLFVMMKDNGTFGKQIDIQFHQQLDSQYLAGNIKLKSVRQLPNLFTICQICLPFAKNVPH
jgi:hypothetical protein